MPRTDQGTPVTPLAPLGAAAYEGTAPDLPPELLEKLRPLAANAAVEQLLDTASDLEASPHPLPSLAGYVRRLALALADVRATVRAKLGPAPFSRLPDVARYAITAAGVDALTDPDDAADTCPATLSLELSSSSSANGEDVEHPPAARAGAVLSRELPASAGLEAGSLPHTRHPAHVWTLRKLDVDDNEAEVRVTRDSEGRAFISTMQTAMQEPALVALSAVEARELAAVLVDRAAPLARIFTADDWNALYDAVAFYETGDDDEGSGRARRVKVRRMHDALGRVDTLRRVLADEQLDVDDSEEARRMREAGFDLVADPVSGLPMWKAVRGPIFESLKEARARLEAAPADSSSKTDDGDPAPAFLLTYYREDGRQGWFGLQDVESVRANVAMLQANRATVIQVSVVVPLEGVAQYAGLLTDLYAVRDPVPGLLRELAEHDAPSDEGAGNPFLCFAVRGVCMYGDLCRREGDCALSRKGPPASPVNDV